MTYTITDISLDDLFELINCNNGLLVVNLGTMVCKPCRTIDYKLNTYFQYSSADITYVKIDINDGVDGDDIYNYYNNNGYINRIPTILVYRYGDNWPEFVCNNSYNLKPLFKFIGNNS